MNTPRNVIVALAALCWLFVLVEGQWYNPQWPMWNNNQNHHHHHHHRRQFVDYDGAQDPNSVDDGFGWSWGAAHRPQGNGNGFSNGGNGFPGGNFNTNNGGGFQRPQPNAPATRSPAAVRTTPTAAPQPATGGATNQPETSSQSATAVVYSDEFYQCMEQCRTTNEWNPVCGSDNNNYNNLEKLNCANSCGGNVRQLRRGPCRPFGK